MEPHIQYAKTRDGVSIAFWTLGEVGTPLLLRSPLTWSHIALEWEIPGLRAWYERLAADRMLVRYDIPGMGMSQRGLVDYSRDAMVSDLESVINRLRLERLDLIGFDGPGGVLLVYAARHPETVSRLVLWLVPVRSQETFGSADRLQALLSLAERDWDLAVSFAVKMCTNLEEVKTDNRLWLTNRVARWSRGGASGSSSPTLLRSVRRYEVSKTRTTASALTSIRQGLPPRLITS